MLTDRLPLDIVVTGLGVICPDACGADEFAALADGAPARETRDGESWFDAPRFLGPRGFKYLPPATRYMLAAAGVAIQEAAVTDGVYAPEHKGVMVGSNFAVASLHDEMDRTILAQGADALSPMEAANFSINLAASHVSMKYGCKGFNICLTSAMVAGLEAVMLGAQSIRRGRAALVVTGATEGWPPAEVCGLLGGTLAEGGACALTLEDASAAERRGAKVLGRFAGGTVAFFDPARLGGEAGRARLEAVLSAALERIPLAESGTLYCHTLECSHPLNEAVADIVRRQLASRGISVKHESAPGADGSLATVSPMLQLAVALHRRQDCLIVTTSPRGHIALASFVSAATPRERGPQRGCRAGVPES